MTSVDNSLMSHGGYGPGRPFPIRALWLIVEGMVLLNPFSTSYRLKASTLRLFGARVGRHVIIKPNVHVKYPWHLTIGDHAWIGERAWIDNFVEVTIGRHACISQGSYLCTGNHDWSDPGMRLIVSPITVGDGAWVGAFARVAPGASLATDSVLTLGSILLSTTQPRTIYAGNPAKAVKERCIVGRVGG